MNLTRECAFHGSPTNNLKITTAVPSETIEMSIKAQAYLRIVNQFKDFNGLVTVLFLRYICLF